MKCNQAGIDLIKDFEGCRYTVYADIVGVPTVGYGSTHGLTKADIGHKTITQEEANQRLLNDLCVAEYCINNNVDAPITENQFSALCSFIFNLGCNAFLKSTLFKLLNEEKYSEAAEQFLRWNLAGGHVVDGLTRRRLAEVNLWNS